MRSAVDQWHQTVVIVTHDPVAASHTDAVLFMADGKLAEQGPPEVIFSHPQSPRLQDFLSKVL